ncbi:MAG: hypothetical protein Kow0025_04910 [Thermodesulfovibrionales bacterium]
MTSRQIIQERRENPSRPPTTQKTLSRKGPEGSKARGTIFPCTVTHTDSACVWGEGRGWEGEKVFDNNRLGLNGPVGHGDCLVGGTVKATQGGELRE